MDFNTYTLTMVNQNRRQISYFAFLPITINKETKWLCRVIILQKYTPLFGWLNIKFLNEKL